MESGRGGQGRGEPVILKGGNTGAPKAKRKKRTPATPAYDPTRPIPQPYLALAPRPISSSRSQQQISSSLVLPSSFRRPTAPTTGSGGGDAGPSTTRNRERERFASGLLAPPTIRAGGATPTTRRAGSPSGNVNGNGRRRTDRDRARGLGAGNPSMTSLGHLGRIMESDPPATIPEERNTTTPANGRRRRRIVRAEGEGDEGGRVTRRLTVSSREEGRALGLARGASMRRLNVWDDVPENDEAPPPFPFPTSSSSRLPPTFESNVPPPAPPVPNSPPPSFEQATGLAPPLTLPPAVSNTITEEPESTTEEGRPPSRTSTRYESAPSSPVLTAPESLDAEEEERSDRRMWNADLLAGYSLEERVQREAGRRRDRDSTSTPAGTSAEISSISAREVEEAVEPGDPTGMTDRPEELVPTPTVESTPPVALPIESEAVVADAQLSPAPMEPVEIPESPTLPTAPISAEDEDDSPLESTLDRTGQASDVQSESPVNASPEVPNTAEATMPTDENSVESENLESREDGDVPERLIVKDSEPSNTIRAGQEIAPISSSPPTAKAVLADPIVAKPEASPPAERKQGPEAAAVTREDETSHPHRPSLSSVHDSTHSLPTLADIQETEVPFASGITKSSGDHILDNANAAPTRKLTRGKAIRRSSSGLIKTLSPSNSNPSSPAPTPLFSAARFDFGRSPVLASQGLPVTHSESELNVASVAGTESKSKLEENAASDQGKIARPFIHRASAPDVRLIHGFESSQQQPRDKRRSEHLGSALGSMEMKGGRRLGDPPLNLDESISAEKERDKTKDKGKDTVIPPHREAALLRRESILAKPKPKSAFPTWTSTSLSGPTARQIKPNSSLTTSRNRMSLPSGPLIDFSDYIPAPITSANGSGHQRVPSHELREIPGLAAANAELLELLEQEASLPQSSSQAADTAALVEDLKNQLHLTDLEEVEEGSITPIPVVPPKTERDRTPPPLPPRPSSVLSELVKKKAPPPPPPVRNRNWTSGQKISIVDTATSPITPRPSIRRPNATINNGGSPTSPTTNRLAPPPIPTRRPPPPPPASESTAPSPPPVRPPLFSTGSNRPVSSISATTLVSDIASSTSSMYDKGPALATRKDIQPPPIPPPWRTTSFEKRSPNKPRGPRPRPPPPPPRPRTWAKVVSVSVSTPQDGIRPSTERTHSEDILSVRTGTGTGTSEVVRSISEQDLNLNENENTVATTGTGTGRRRVPEYTDLDVFVSRLEGSGREYEGFSHIAQFLGPAKSPAAPSEALSTLLPGPITIESRRTTKEGKVKLKLSLLGVRVTKCPICLAQFRDQEMGVILPVCGHYGHEGCARRWFREDDRCFVCREKLKGGEGVV